MKLDSQINDGRNACKASYIEMANLYMCKFYIYAAGREMEA